MKLTSLLFMLLFLIKPSQSLSESNNLLHICTVASKPNLGLTYLQKSCIKNNFSLIILGWNRPYSGNITKLYHIKNYIADLPDDHILLYIDGYDVMLFGNEEELLEKFYSFNAPFIISVERGKQDSCWGVPDILFPQIPTSPTLFKYLNSGGYIGYVGAIKEILNELSTDLPDKTFKNSDQVHLMYDFFEHPEKYTFDYHAKIFMNLHRLHEQHYSYDNATSRVFSTTTNTYPIVVHGNARGGKKILKKLWEIVFPQS